MAIASPPLSGFRARLRDGGRLLATFLMIPRVEILEMLASAGFDAVVVDLEHAPIEVQHLPALAAAGRGALEESRQRTGRDRIDIAYIHDPDLSGEDWLASAIDACHPALVALREAGELGAIGVGTNFVEPLLAILERVELDCALLAGRYTLLEQEPLEELFPLMEERGMSVVNGAVYNSGLLVAPRPDSTWNYAPAPPEVLARAQRLESVCTEHEVPLRAAALQFAAAHPLVASVVMGARTPAEVTDNLAMARLDIPSELWVALKEQELLHPDAPTPDAPTPG